MMSATEGKSKVPVFDSKADSFDHWKIQWNAFTEVKGVVDALGPKQDPNIPHNSKHILDPDKEMKKLMILATKGNNQAKLYFSLVFKTMKLLRLITKANNKD
jgi:hypothetical protein